MKKFPVFLIVLCFTAVFAKGQDTITHHPLDPQYEQKKPLKDRLFFGGDLGLQFGDITNIYLAPLIGYKLTDKLAIGGGPSYSYFKINGDYYGFQDYTANAYGGRLFGQYRVIENAMAYAEYSLINSDVIDDISFKQTRANIASLLVGGGYVQPISQNSSFNLMVLFDVIQDRYSYTQNPIIRAGFNVGF